MFAKKKKFNEKSRYTNPKHNKSALLNKQANNSVDNGEKKQSRKTIRVQSALTKRQIEMQTSCVFHIQLKCNA